MRKGDLSKFVEDAVRWGTLDSAVQGIKDRNQGIPTEMLESLVDDAIREVRDGRETEYVHLAPHSVPPGMAIEPGFKAILIIDEETPEEWQASVGAWLVRSGCLYLMAWGKQCDAWEEAVDAANLKEHGFGEIPEERFVMTTSHKKEALQDVFWYSKHVAFHPIVELQRTVLVHISSNNQSQALLKAYSEA